VISAAAAVILLFSDTHCTLHRYINYLLAKIYRGTALQN